MTDFLHDELPDQEKQFIAKARTARDVVKGAIHQQMSLYGDINSQDRNNMERLGALITRLKGHEPQEALNGDPHKVPDPNGLLDGIERLNSTHAHHSEIIGHMISKLEELI